VACHAQSLNLFVESFLKTVQKLLETTEPTLQTLASQSFVKFANIEEDTPSYHLRYDFFVSKFASLCHNNHNEVDLRNNLRIAGLRGIQGVVRKTVSDDLVENIWEPVHMDKIIPSLLYNMQYSRSRKMSSEQSMLGNSEESSDALNPNIHPSNLAENCLRELVGRASFGTIRSVITPVFKHLDLHELWEPNDFAIYTFRVIMFSIQVQYSYAVVEILISHLDSSSRSKALVRTSMANVLAKIIAIAAGESVGPSVLEIVNSLLNNLKQSVMADIPVDAADTVINEKHFQESLIGALAEFAFHLPDYQKIEIMIFIIGRTPGTDPGVTDFHLSPAEILLQHMLLKCLLKVSYKYRTTNYLATLPLNFLDPLLRMSLAQDSEVRLLVQHIFHSLIDRHDNREKLKQSNDYGNYELIIEKCSRTDSMFYKNNGSKILYTLAESLGLPNTTAETIEAIFCTAALISVELVSDDILVDIIRWALSVQDTAVVNVMLRPAHRSYLHVVALSIIALMAQIMKVSPLQAYVSKVAAARAESSPHLLPNSTPNEASNVNNLKSECLLDYKEITECMQKDGRDATGIKPSQAPYLTNHRQSLESSHYPTSTTDLSNTNTEIESNASSPGMPRRQAEEEVTFEILKQVLAESVQSRREAEIEKRQIICEKFRNTPFQQLVANSESKGDVLNETLTQILTRISVQPQPNSVSPNPSLPLYNNNFPDLFVY